MGHRPNLLLVLTDQQQADMTARQGFPQDLTPFADELALQGVEFPNAYTSSPVCTPARISLLTGRYPSAHGILENQRRLDAPNFPDPWIVDKSRVEATTNLFELLGQRGYRRALVGKNHAHVDNDDFEFVRSFHHRGGFYEGKKQQEEEFDEWIDALHHTMAWEAAPFPVELQIPHRIVDTAIDWLEEGGQQPFALWVSFPEPHNPYQVPEPYHSLFDGQGYVPPAASPADLANKNDRWQVQDRILCHALREEDVDAYVRRCRANYMGMVRLLDDQMRRLAGALEQRGLYENTLIVILSDHGDMAGEFGLLRKGLELSELLTRIPLIFAGAGVQPTRVPDGVFASIVDILPTLCDALGLEVPPDVQGTSLWPLISGAAECVGATECVYTEWGNGTPQQTWEDFQKNRNVLLREGFHELNEYVSSGLMRGLRRGRWKLTIDSLGRLQLYDLCADPQELNNLTVDGAHTEVREQLLHELGAKMLEVSPHRRPTE